MCRYRRVVAGLLVLLSGAALASEPVRDVRREVGVTLVKTSGGGVAAVALDALDRRLTVEGFDVTLVDSLPEQPSEYLGKAPLIKHLIVNCLSTNSQDVEATVYTRGVPSPRTFQAKSPNELVSKISAYLGSETMVMQRISTVLGPDAFSKHIQRGLQFMLVEKDMNAAIGEFTEASRLEPQNPLPHQDLALVYRQTGNQVQRRKHIEEGLRLDPENEPLKNEKAVLFLEEDRFREAIAVLRELPPDDPVAQWNLSLAYWNLGEKESATAELKRIIELQADPRLASIAESRLQELEREAARLAMMRKSLWVSLVGLGCVGVIGCIILLARFATRGSRTLKGLKPSDVFALKVQVVVTAISCVFGLMTVILPRVLAK
jgi:Flp pilus assembly protein TadD